MPLTLNYDGLDEATASVLKSEPVQALLTAAFEGASSGEAALKANRDAILGEKKELERKLAEIEALGGLAALKAVPELDKTVKTKTAAESTYAEQVRELQKQLTAMKDQVVNKELQAKLSQEIRDAQGAPELLESHIKSRIKHELDQNGQLKITVLDKNGIPLICDGRDATIKDLLSEFKGNTVLARAFDAPALNGAGTKPTNGSGAPNPFAKTTLNLSEQGRLVRTDRTEAIRLANAAGVQIQGLNT